jgi:hypothetical protein
LEVLDLLADERSLELPRQEDDDVAVRVPLARRRRELALRVRRGPLVCAGDAACIGGAAHHA